MTMDVTLLRIASLFYLIAAGVFVVYLVLLRDLLSRLAPVLLLGGFVAHAVALGLHFFHPESYPAGSHFREALALYSWLMVAVYLLVQLKYRLTILGSFIAPLAFLMSLGAFASGAGIAEIPRALQTYWLPVHVALAFLGNAVFALAFAVSLMYLLQEYQLKHKKLSVLQKRFPSLEALDRFNYIFLVWGFPFMTLGIITGSVLAGVQWGDYWSWDPRQITSAITWLLYGALLQGRITAGWRGRKAALLTIVGFAVVLGYFLLGSSMFPSRHTGRFE